MSLAQLGFVTLGFATMAWAQRGGAVGRPVAAGRPFMGSPNGRLGPGAGVMGGGTSRFGPSGWGRRLCFRRPVYPRQLSVTPIIPFYGGASFPVPPDYTNDYLPPDYNQEPLYPSPAALPQSSEANQEDFPATEEQTLPASPPSEMRLYRWESQPYADNDEHAPMIAFKNGGMFTVVKYWSKGKVLNFITTQGDHLQVALDLVDRIYPSSNRSPTVKGPKH